ncbi:LysR family transcriptional regulator [Pseudomonas sp. JQ170]|uniref:LysR substrate-binding domain-containing protein n=1 Tax=unclassified Pseudomonas TaxID=196821 RepID=UPI0026509E1A|nr:MULTISPECIES: LysR substrate-binding domain-containing protein [unclassified Pseudomonas]MDN7144027.1 LysR family transcriptional regulator [Pseudomonas sp. JQ170]WRO74984.1 LysR substrate-binding domain-containing protein [Pseudomonas sp. 170C]
MGRLPPLNAVKAFEVAARTGSFVLAAEELGVSAAAISQQVRHLEDFLERKLFVRTGNRITLTDAGHAIYPQTSRALNDIAAMTTRILEGDLHSRRLVISVPFSLAETWLAPKLLPLQEQYPNLAIDIRVEDDPVDLIRHDIDIRVSYGDYHYPALTAVHLVRDEVIPVCTPDFWSAHGNDEFDLSQISQNLFIHTHWGASYASGPTWHDWFSLISSKYHPDPKQGVRSGLSSLSVSLALLGLGIALAHKLIAQSELESGRLINLSSMSLPLGHPYCAFVPTGKMGRNDITRMMELLGG